MPNIPSMEDMLKAGVHFGHRASKWHPKMEPFIYTVRNGIHVVDLKKTTAALEKACEFVTTTVAAGGDILFVGTKTQAKSVIEEQAKACSMPYVKNRWLGGTITNFREIRKSVKHYLDLVRQKDSGEWQKYTKKEQIGLQKELDKLTETVSGLASLERIPRAVFIVDIMQEKTAVHEATTQNIPIVAICDTNTNPSKVKYPIPGNDDASRGVAMFIEIISQAVQEGLKQRKVVPAADKKPLKKAIKKVFKKVVGDSKKDTEPTKEEK